MASGTSRFLSYVGRASLVKVVLMTIQVYWSQIFLIPASVIPATDEIEAILRAFLWPGMALNRRKAIVAWDKLCTPVNEGGLGFKNLRQWNIALLFKQIWTVEKSKERLWVKWIHVYYLKGVFIWQYQAKPSCPLVLKALLHVRDVMYCFVCFNSGSPRWPFSLDGNYSVPANYRALCPPVSS